MSSDPYDALNIYDKDDVAEEPMEKLVIKAVSGWFVGCAFFDDYDKAKRYVQKEEIVDWICKMDIQRNKTVEIVELLLQKYNIEEI